MAAHSVTLIWERVLAPSDHLAKLRGGGGKKQNRDHFGLAGLKWDPARSGAIVPEMYRRGTATASPPLSFLLFLILF